MPKEIASMTDSKGNDITVIKSDGCSLTQLLTLGFAGNDTYAVKINGSTVSTSDRRGEAISCAASKASK